MKQSLLAFGATRRPETSLEELSSELETKMEQLERNCERR